jgi:hypothetical protein
MWENLTNSGQLLHSIGGLLSVMLDGATYPRLSCNRRRTVNVSACVYSRLSLGYRCAWCSETCSWSRCKVHYTMTCSSLCVGWFRFEYELYGWSWHWVRKVIWCDKCAYLIDDAVLTCSCDDRIRADHKKVLVLTLVICAEDVFVY